MWGVELEAPDDDVRSPTDSLEYSAPLTSILPRNRRRLQKNTTCFCQSSNTPICQLSASGGSADASPVPARNETRDQRRFGGSSKGRKFYRWTPRQELAAVEAMVEIRAEGEVVGDSAFEELHRRLVARIPGWNHGVSGNLNAWHRRKLVHKVYRAEARIAREKPPCWSKAPDSQYNGNLLTLDRIRQNS